MRRALIVIAAIVVLCVLVLLGFAYHRHASKIAFRWNYINSPQFPNCTASLRKSCISGFTLTDATDSQVITSAIGPGDRSFTYSPADGIQVGYEHRFSLVANAVDSSGMPLDSLPIWVTIRYSLWSSLRNLMPGAHRAAPASAGAVTATPQ